MNFSDSYFTHPLWRMQDSFSIIAIRCNRAPDYIRKKLETKKLYYLLDGYDIKSDYVIVNEWRTSQDYIYDEYFESHQNKPRIQFSAIVGENGSGKSSIVEFLMRMINNLSASVFGEAPSGPAVERLHYIPGIDGEMWYKLGRSIYKLLISDTYVKIDCLSEGKDGEIKYTSPKKIYENHLYEEKCSRQYRQPDDVVVAVCSQFFYTIVSNYSIYAYNTHDYILECDSQEKEAYFSADAYDSIFSVEQRCWLHGLFHKNDGYQIPLVLTPFRREGNIDINTETELARERLVLLLIKQENLREINGHLRAKSISWRISGSFEYAWMKEKLEMPNLTEKGYNSIRNDIIRYWFQLVGVEIPDASTVIHYDTAINYLVYKTLKISKQYKEYEGFYKMNSLMVDAYSKEALYELIEKESRDTSHVTRKILQTLGHILYGVYDLNVEFMDLRNLWLRWSNKVITPNGVELSKIRNEIQLNAIYPPPFVDFDVDLFMIDNDKEVIPFQSLSSGERQQVYSVTSILYHLDNINSVANDKNGTRTAYEYVNVILEEIELYYHPELQRNFIKYLLDAIDQMSLEYIKAINFIIVTHSPYLLSDIPRTNVLAMRKDDHNHVPLKTFGANIHDILRDSFFLSNGAIGEFALWEIKHILKCIDVYQWILENGIDRNSKLQCPYYGKEEFEFLDKYFNHVEKRFAYGELMKDISHNVIKNRIEVMDEPIIRDFLMSKYEKMIQDHTFHLSKQEKIAELKRQLKELEGK